MSSGRLELRVGLFMLVCLALAAALAILFSNTNMGLGKGYTVVMEIPSAGNLIRQAEVRMAGVSIGYVDKIELNKHGNGTEIDLHISEPYRVHEMDVFSVASRGLMGDQYVSVEAAAERGPKLTEGGRVKGKAPMNLEKLGARISVLVERLDNDMLNNATISHLTHSIANLDEFTGKAKDFFNDETISDLNSTIIDMRKFAKEANSLLSNGDLNATIVNVRDASRELKNFSKGLDESVEEILNVGKNAAKDVGGTATAIKQITEKINSTVSRMEILVTDTQPKLAKVMANAAKTSEAVQRAAVNIDQTVATNKVIVGQTLANVQQLTGRLDKTAIDIQATVSANRGNIEEIVANVKEVSKNLKETTGNISKVVALFEKGEGLAGGVFKDKGMRKDFSQMVTNFSYTASRLSAFVSNLNEHGMFWKGEQRAKHSRNISNNSTSPRPFPYPK